MNNLSTNEIKLITLLRDIHPFESVDIKCDDKGKVSITHTIKNQFIFKIVDGVKED